MGLLDLGRHHIRTNVTSKAQCPSVEDAVAVFSRRARKLLDVSQWNRLSGLENSRFALYDDAGRRLYRHQAAVGDHIAIAVPLAGLVRTDWVRIERIDVTATSVTLTVRPSHDPTRRPLMEALTAHFFSRATTNTFMLERRGPWLIARVEGRNECANVGPECESAQHALANRMLAEGGWWIGGAGPQAHQWEVFTRRLVGR